MQTQAPTPSPQALPPLAVLLYPLLLTQTCTATLPSDPGSLVPEMLAVRAAHITVVLSHILDDRGYFHGGLNE